MAPLVEREYRALEAAVGRELVQDAYALLDRLSAGLRAAAARAGVDPPPQPSAPEAASAPDRSASASRCASCPSLTEVNPGATVRGQDVRKQRRRCRDAAVAPPARADALHARLSRPLMDTPIARNSLCLGSLPARHARYRPHHTAVVVSARAPGEREVRLDWREFDAYVNRWAHALAALGVARGDRVATVLPESARTPGDVLGVREAGRGDRAAVAAADGDRPRVAAARRGAARRARDVGRPGRRWTRRGARCRPRRRGCWSTRRRTTRRRAIARTDRCTRRRPPGNPMRRSKPRTC